MLHSALQLLEAGRDLSMSQMSEAIGLVMEGRCGEEEIARLLVGLHRKGETVAEVAGAAAAMRRHMTPIRTSRSGVIDTCGTGGDGSGTFNISTAAALVTAAAGVPVAKHGNRGITSRSGSADVLAALGVNIDADVACVEACLDELGICFCFAPLMHQAMRHVGADPQEAGPPDHLQYPRPVGQSGRGAVSTARRRTPRVAAADGRGPALLGTRRSLVVHGADGLDEVTLGGATHVTEADGRRLARFQVDCRATSA